MGFLASKKKLFIAGASLAAIAASYAFLPETKETSDQGPNLAAVVEAIASSTESFGKAMRSTGCAVDGPLPDRACSPGAVFASAGLDQICIAGYTKKARSVSVSLKKKIYKAYGIAYPQKVGSFELDHIVPLELGGSNEPANLFPEARDPAPGFKEKDVVENFLHQEACAGRISLASAQKAIAADWLKIYQSMAPEQIKTMKELYKSWSD